ncbi:MAG: hypothetical protein M1819_004468 [Sarea resinae]|nr:MAG: hypothetical protein M1819_004468 [Sarea resinae]
MATAEHLRHVQEIVRYTFVEPGYLKQALTAAGAEEENHDGNRKLAQVGDLLIKLVLLIKSFFAGASRGDANDILQTAASRKRRATVAKATHIDACIRCSPWQSGQSTPPLAVLNLAISAIVGAAWHDSGQSFAIVSQVVQQLGLDPQDHTYVDPNVISPNQNIPVPSDQSISFDERETTPSCAVRAPISPFTWNAGLFSQSSSDDATLFNRNGSPGVQRVDIISSQELNSDTTGATDLEILELTPNLEVPLREVSFPTSEEHFPSSVVWQRETGDDQGVYSDKFGGALLENEHLEDIVGIQSDPILASHLAHRRSNKQSDLNQIRPEETTLDYNIGSNAIDEVIDRALSGIEEIGVPAAPCPQNAIAMTRGCAVKRKPSSNSSTGSKRARRRNYRTGLREETDALLGKHCFLESVKCQNLGLPCPEQTFNLSRMRNFLSDPCVEGYKLALTDFSLEIASSGSLALLQDIIQASRHSPMSYSRDTGFAVSNVERLKAIGRLDKGIAYSGLLRRYHVLQLYRDSRGSSSRVVDGFVMDTNDIISRTAKRSNGNPLNNSHAEITKSLMQEVHPELQGGTSVYEQKYRKIKGLQKLGQRLDLLTTRFGDGIIGLLPPNTNLVSGSLAYVLADNTISPLPDNIFTEFIKLLDQCQGDMLRKFSDAARVILDYIFYGQVDGPRHFPIEQIERAQIENQPKGSPRLLELLAPITSNDPYSATS